MSSRRAKPPFSDEQNEDLRNQKNEIAPNTSARAGSNGSGSAPFPSKSTSVSSKSRAKHPVSPIMHTIDSTDSYGSDGRPMQPPPSGPLMFSNSIDDSDGSDGSIVFNNSQAKKPPSPSNQQPKRENRSRFPSFDSMASSGSLVKHGPQQRNSMTPRQVPKVTQQNLAHVNPQMLPYDQRRKLMQMKKQQQQAQRNPSPPRERRPDIRYLPNNSSYNTMTPDFQTIQSSFNGVPMQALNPPQMFMPGAPPHPMQMPIPGGPYPPSHNSKLTPYRGAPPRFDSSRPPSQKNGGRNIQYQYQGAIVSQRPSIPNPNVRAPQNRFPNQTGGDRLIPSSSLDSSDPYGPEMSFSRNPIQPETKGPPPPPPPPMPPNHVRAESTGSVSSLGSQGSIFGYVGNQDEGEGKRSSFLQLLNPFSPKNKRSKSPQAATADFHRKNQYFLKQSVVGRVVVPLHPSPKSSHQRVGSMDRPPASRGTHKRLPSIENDNWDESDFYGIERVTSTEHSSEEKGGESSQASSSEDSRGGEGYTRHADVYLPNERTSLLPPPGQASSERQSDNNRSGRRRRKAKASQRNGRQTADIQLQDEEAAPTPSTNLRNADDTNPNRRKKKKKNRRTRRSRKHAGENSSQSSSVSGHQSSSSSSYDYRQWTRRRAKMLEEERERLISQWKAEARAEALASRRQLEDDQWHRRLWRYLNSKFGEILVKIDLFICNLPLTIGAISLAITLLGVVWFKFVEEKLASCEPVQFHSSQCTFPEFPGCFYCDKTAPMYKFAVNFHFACSAIGGLLALCYLIKMGACLPLVIEEMSSPTTASPAGLLCMTTVCVFAGRGFVGQILVSLASSIHLGLVVWFIYMALAYHIMPEPSWFPCTVGIGISAVKTWLYYPMSGHFLMAVSLILVIFFFPISLIRVLLNEKISATVAYMQMSAPAISLYALTLMAQPTFEQEQPDINRFQRAHRLIYLPCMHCLFVLSIIGALASLQALASRWKEFRKQPFSPAHAAFCYPTLLHANAVQAYRASINSFSDVPSGSSWKVALDVYWVSVLVGGTVVAVWVSGKYFYNLPRWTCIDTEGEEEPPPPYETFCTIQNVIAMGDSLVQPFVSPAVLQANETGLLVVLRRAGERRLLRSRKIAALGFEPVMTWSEMEDEKRLLEEWLGKNPSTRRGRNLSVPGIDFTYDSSDGRAPDPDQYYY